jgi:DNA (cytosine-5)-methyltransferase 1
MDRYNTDTSNQTTVSEPNSSSGFAINTEPQENNEYKEPIIFSFFSGAGFLDLGFEKAGYEIGYVNEVHKPFLEAYKYSRQKMGTPPPIHGYFEGNIESCIAGEEAERVTR